MGAISFAMMQALPGDAAFRIAAGRYGYDLMDAASAEAVRHELGLDRPLAVQLGAWLASLARLDLGVSLVSGGSIAGEIAHQLGHSLQLAFGAALVSIVVAVPVGVVAGSVLGVLASWQGGWTDRLLGSISDAVLALPGLLLVLMLAAIAPGSWWALYVGISLTLSGRLWRGPGLPATGVQKLYQDPPAAFPNRVTLLASLRDVSRRHAVPWERVEELLAALGVGPGLLHRRPTEVSGGELQRIALARVLMIRPAVLLADEPTSRMDPITQASVIRLIARAAAEHGSAVVLVTHDREIAERWAPEIRTVPALHAHDARG